MVAIILKLALAWFALKIAYDIGHKSGEALGYMEGFRVAAKMKK